jgi:methionine synthase reductase
VELLLELLPPLAPRYYSLSSSPLAAEGPSSVGFAFTVVEYATPSGAARAGLATTYLAAIAASMTAGGGGGGGSSSSSSSLCCFAKPTPSFHLPEDASTPCVLIGPGTGVAPFVGFAQHRLAQGWH